MLDLPSFMKRLLPRIALLRALLPIVLASWAGLLGGFSLLAAAPAEQPSLKDAFRGRFLVGAALNPSYFTGANALGADLVKAQFNSVTPENAMKWAPIHPHPDQYEFQASDRYVDFGMKNGMFVIGHTLVWHSQTPAWVFADASGKPVDRQVLLDRMRDHIRTVVGRYKGRVKGWDVVNEALEENGTLRNSPWCKIIGEDYIEKAFQLAHEADPQAELYYNDYRIEVPSKRKGAVALLTKLKAAGIPVAGVGIQEHVTLTWPALKDLDETIAEFGKLGLKVMITELDVNVLPGRPKNAGNADVNLREAADPALNPYTNGLPDDLQKQLAARYAELFGAYLQHAGVISRVTVWGVADGDSWLNHSPIPGRTNYPLLFDRSYRPKPAFSAVFKVASAGTRTTEPGR